MSISPEKEIDIGRINEAAEGEKLEKLVYITELKIVTSEVALKQVKEKNIMNPGKSIILVGIGIAPSFYSKYCGLHIRDFSKQIA